MSAERPHPAAPLPPTTRAAAPLVGFSTRLPPDLLRRLQIAAPQLDLRQAEITAHALDEWLGRHGH